MKSGSGKIATYVLDTSALLAFLEDEPGADLIDKLLADERHQFIISYLTLYECYYLHYQRRSKSVADLLLRSTLQLGFEVSYSNDLNEIISAGSLKGAFRLSAIDAWIAALAIRKRATLVHKDPEFEALKDYVDLLALPYK